MKTFNCLFASIAIALLVAGCGDSSKKTTDAVNAVSNVVDAPFTSWVIQRCEELSFAIPPLSKRLLRNMGSNFNLGIRGRCRQIDGIYRRHRRSAQPRRWTAECVRKWFWR